MVALPCRMLGDGLTTGSPVSRAMLKTTMSFEDIGQLKDAIDRYWVGGMGEPAWLLVINTD
jgi:hypothetical protein